MAKTGLEKLEGLKYQIYKCIHCKACRFAYSNEPSKEGIGKWKGKQKIVLYEGMVDSCPAGIEYGWEAYWNAGKMWIARSLLNGDLKISEKVRDVIFPCITCGQCASQCDNKIQTVDIIESMRAACVDAGVPLIEKHQLIKKLVEENNNPYGGKGKDRFKWAKDNGFEKYIDNPKAKIGYYVGCTASYRQMDIAISTCKLLEKLGIDFTLISDEVCCGSPFFRIGVVNVAQDLMRKNIENFKNLEKVYFSCAGCYRTFSIDYPKWNEIDVIPFKMAHAFELISDLIIEGKLKFRENNELKDKIITYHDPCHTGRHFGLEIEQKMIEQSKNLMLDRRKIQEMIYNWFEIPRIILKQLEQDVGMVFKEMYRIKMDSMCCGAGGGVRAGYPDFSLRTSSLRCDEANAIGADILTTECPFCKTNLTDANNLYEHGLKVFGLLQLLDEYNLIELSK